MHLMQKCIFAYIFQRKMFSCAKMHLMQKCIFATHHILRSKMFSITFDFVKCSATLCKNAFDAYILFCVALPKCILASNAFLHQMHFCINKMLQMHLMPKCILAYIFQRKMFSCAKMHLMQKCI